MFTAWNLKHPNAERPEDFTRQLEREIAEMNQRLIDRTEAYMNRVAGLVAEVNGLKRALEEHKQS
jgi:phage host-nuclease inhibitor protein Gam